VASSNGYFEEKFCAGGGCGRKRDGLVRRERGLRGPNCLWEGLGGESGHWGGKKKPKKKNKTGSFEKKSSLGGQKKHFFWGPPFPWGRGGLFCRKARKGKKVNPLKKSGGGWSYKSGKHRKFGAKSSGEKSADKRTRGCAGRGGNQTMQKGGKGQKKRCASPTWKSTPQKKKRFRKKKQRTKNGKKGKRVWGCWEKKGKKEETDHVWTSFTTGSGKNIK